MRRVSATDERHTEGSVPTENEPENNEERLIELASGGDHEAFNTLVRKYRCRLLNDLRNARPELTYEDIEDIVQESFIAAFNALKRFRGESAFYSWLFRIGMNRATSLWRCRQAHKSVRGVRLFDDDEQLLHMSTPCALAIERETTEIILNVLASLSDTDRRMLTLRGLEGWDYEDIAECLDIPNGTVKSRLSRARKEMRRRLDKAGL